MAARKKKTKKKAVKRKVAAKPKSAASTAKPKPEKKADIREVSKYALLLTQKIDAEDKVKKINGEIAKLFPHVLDYFQRQGIDQIAAGGRTLYLRRELHTNKSKDVTTEQACQKLRDIGLADYAGEKINSQGLAAYVRELEEGGQAIELIEEQFGGAFRVAEVFKIGSRKR
jgi:hypothetical protein